MPNISSISCSASVTSSRPIEVIGLFFRAISIASLRSSSRDGWSAIQKDMGKSSKLPRKETMRGEKMIRCKIVAFYSIKVAFQL